ncbi:MAG: DMP19 family protein [Clostridia bacterium]|nr:DMP19 family protein [Clostridia bacterium]
MFGLFRKKKVEPTEKDLKWDKMWQLWTEERTDSPYSELMTYLSEVNNGGHSQYFDNVSGVSDLQSEMSALKTILPPQLASAVEQAYAAHLILEERNDKQAEEILRRCDDVFYKREEEINRILEEYASTIEL